MLKTEKFIDFVALKANFTKLEQQYAEIYYLTEYFEYKNNVSILDYTLNSIEPLKSFEVINLKDFLYLLSKYKIQKEFDKSILVGLVTILHTNVLHFNTFGNNELAQNQAHLLTKITVLKTLVLNAQPRTVSFQKDSLFEY